MAEPLFMFAMIQKKCKQRNEGMKRSLFNQLHSRMSPIWNEAM